MEVNGAEPLIVTAALVFRLCSPDEVPPEKRESSNEAAGTEVLFVSRSI